MPKPFAGAVRRAFMMAVCGALLAPAAWAADTGQAAAVKAGTAAMVPAVLIVDLPQVLHDSAAGKGVQATVTKRSQEFSRQVAREEDDLQKMRGDLERQRTVMAPKAFDAKAKAFQQHYQALDRDVQTKRQLLQRAYNEAMLKVEKAALDIIAQLAKERGANLVLAKQATILQAKGSDVTAEVVRTQWMSFSGSNA